MNTIKTAGYGLVYTMLTAAALAQRDPIGDGKSSTPTQTPAPAPADNTLYYVIGGVIVLAAVIYVLTKKKK